MIFFFFQAEDGIRDVAVTGVQTCALPIWMLTLEELERLGKEIGVRMKTVRQPDAARRRAANYWYEVRMRDTKKDEMRNALFREQHPVEKMKRVGLGPLTVEGVQEGRYEMLRESEVEKLQKALRGGKGSKGNK